MKALSRLGEQQGFNAGQPAPDQDSSKPPGHSRRQAQQGLNNMRRLLPPVKRWTIESIREAAGSCNLQPSEWTTVTRLIQGARKIVPDKSLQGVAGVRDDRLSEILVDSSYAPYLTSDDEAVFVLGHELMHVAARSGKLDCFIDGVAENAKRTAFVEPTQNQKEDLACDFVGELVLKRFISLNPAGESQACRVSRVFGYESPAERFARAWEDFCASYNGDVGDETHLTQYQTIRALEALDPELCAMMPEAAGSVSLKVRGQSGE